MLYPTLHRYNKFLLTVYPIIYYCQPNARENIHTQLMILAIQIGTDNAILYVNRNWKQFTPYFTYIKPIITVSTLACISHQMSLIHTDNSTMLSSLSLMICKWISDTAYYSTLWSLCTPIAIGISYVYVRPLIQESVREIMTLEYVNRLIDTINNAVTQTPSTREKLKENEMIFLCPIKYKGNDTTVLKDVTCSICLEQVTENKIYRQLPCKHCFHPWCIDKWLLECSNKCPCCNTKLEMKNITIDTDIDTDIRIVN